MLSPAHKNNGAVNRLLDIKTMTEQMLIMCEHNQWDGLQQLNTNRVAKIYSLFQDVDLTEIDCDVFRAELGRLVELEKQLRVNCQKEALVCQQELIEINKASRSAAAYRSHNHL